MDTVGTGSASQFRLSERQLGWRPPYPRRGRGPSICGTRFILRDGRRVADALYELTLSGSDSSGEEWEPVKRTTKRRRR